MELKINSKFLYYLRPESAIGYALAFFFLLLCIAPIKIINTLDWTSVMYMLSGILFFLLGTQLIRPGKRKKTDLVISIKACYIHRIYRVTFILGSLGVLLRCIDLLVFRGISLANTVMDNFDAAEEGGGNFFSIFSAFFIFFAYIPFTIDMLFPQLHGRIRKLISILLILSTAVTTIFFGSRFAIMTPLLYGVIILFYSKRIKFSLKWFCGGIFTFLVILNLIGSLFLNRLSEMGMTGARSVVSEHGGYSDKVPATPEFVQLLNDSESTFYYPYLFAYSHICQYFTHAVFEFPVVKGYIDQTDKYFYGGATFGVFYKLIAKLAGLSQSDVRQYNARPGIWSTFFFCWYLDFRWWGVFLMTLLGILFKFVWNKVYSKGNIFCLPLYVFCFIILLFILQLNFIAGSGTYALFSFTLLPWLCKIKYSYYLVDKTV